MEELKQWIIGFAEIIDILFKAFYPAIVVILLWRIGNAISAQTAYFKDEEEIDNIGN